LESKCHTGQTILYDTVTVKGWSPDIRTHRIGEIINKVLADPWPTETEPNLGEVSSAKFGWWGWGRKGPKPGQGKDEEDDGGWERHGGVPKAVADKDCIDCFKW
jgi:lipase ATG15